MTLQKLEKGRSNQLLIWTHLLLIYAVFAAGTHSHSLSLFVRVSVFLMHNATNGRLLGRHAVWQSPWTTCRSSWLPPAALVQRQQIWIWGRWAEIEFLSPEEAERVLAATQSWTFTHANRLMCKRRSHRQRMPSSSAQDTTIPELEVTVLRPRSSMS
jgi:hypothetical protein